MATIDSFGDSPMVPSKIRHLALTFVLAWAAALAPCPMAGGDPALVQQPVRLIAVDLREPGDLLTIAELGADILARDSPTRVRVAATDQEIAALESSHFCVSMIEPDVELAARRRLGAGYEIYHTFDEVVAELHELHARHPDLVGVPLVIGSSWEGRPLLAVKISDHPERDEDEPRVLFDALHHAREPAGMETILHAMKHIAENAGRDPDLRALVEERELWFVPVVNPDGYVFCGVGGLWRKNRRPNADGSFGVDLNRNYGHAWGADDVGSSPAPASPIYRGPAPFSEPETAAMRDFVLARRFTAGMTMHTFGDLNLLPNESAMRTPAVRARHEDVAHDLEALTGYPHGRARDILYRSNGRTQDWLVAATGMVVIEPEIGSPSDGFWPAPKRLLELAQGNLPAMLHLARIAGPHLVTDGYTVDDGASGDANGAVDPGETVVLRLALRNIGLVPARDVTVTVSTESPLITVLAGRAEIVEIPAGAVREIPDGTLRIRVAPDARPGEPIPLSVEAKGPGTASPAMTLEIIPGTPALLFADDAEGGLDRWIAVRGWGVVTTSEGGSAFSDSPDGPYRAHANSMLTLRTPLDLRGVARPRLTYMERLAAEPWQDRCLVEAWTPRLGWQTLIAVPGGVESRFREREVSLAELAGESEVRLRFRLLANHEREADGWTIDDIRIWGYRTVDAPIFAVRAAGSLSQHRAGTSSADEATPME